MSELDVFINKQILMGTKNSGKFIDKVFIWKELYKRKGEMSINMKKFNLIVVFNENLDKVLFCVRAKKPYKGLYNFVGGKVEEKNKLEWVDVNDELLNTEKFAGNYNIPHIIRQIKIY